MFIILGADGKEYGPVPARKIHEWIHEGRANLETKAKRVNETAWKSVGEFVEFGGAPASTPPVIETAPPTLNAPLETGPVFTAAAPVQVVTPPASLGLRFLAAAIDGFLKMLCVLPTTIPLFRFVAERAREGEMISFQESVQATTQVLAENAAKSVPYLVGLLCVQMTLIAIRGQSVGKLLTGMRIVRAADEAPAGFARGFLLRSMLPYFVQQLPIIGAVFWLVDTCFIFREDRRCLHDLAAGTKVIPVNKQQG